MGSDLEMALQSTEVVIFIILVGVVASLITAFVAIIGFMVKINSMVGTYDSAYAGILGKKNKEIRTLTNEVLLLRALEFQLKTENEDLRCKLAPVRQ